MRSGMDGSVHVGMLDVGQGSEAGQGQDRRRRGIGALALAVAVAAFIVLPGVLAQGVPGVASAAPLPEPPPVGSCLSMGVDQVTQVPCDRLHMAEVFAVWPADSPPDAASAEDHPAPAAKPYGSGGVADHPVDLCWAAMDRYLGNPPPGMGALWTPIALQAVPRIISAPSEETVGLRRWQACVLMAPFGQASTGTLRNAGSPDYLRPAAFGSCVWSGSGSVIGVMGCEGPHQIEILGYFNPTPEMVQAGSTATAVTAQEIQDSCLALAARLTGSADPTYGGRIRISARPLFNSNYGFPASDGSGPPGLTVPDCFAELVGEGALAGTVIGLGDRPLPIR